ncbi:hypothetical protein [Micromonospora sp. WMMD1082]|uniref:hypothetical protein n=1 Tax=Micromonospora sp. WMMD1082 TaxID=3016104 RepID=UPI002415A1B7|nr:hypothetical protein [Micromonospora sp. WMMD1082]MDG4796217.1 hypothetical protein [Micromonospora sp. WMMD1082]
MGFSVQVSGGRDLTAVRRQLRVAGDRRLSQQMSRALSRAAKPLKPAVQASAVRLLPSGYGPLMSKSLRLRTQARERRGAATVSIRVHAAGKVENRDVARINAGTLRHPVFGKRRKAWIAQRVRRGFVDRPVDGMTPDVVREMHAVVDWVADTITRG